MSGYENIKAFYDAEPRRRWSGEADYGVRWTNGPGWSYWRVSYIQATGEVYAVSERGRPQDFNVEVLGIVPPDDLTPGRVYYRTLDRLLDGWAKGGERDVSWVKERLKAWQGARSAS